MIEKLLSEECTKIKKTFYKISLKKRIDNCCTMSTAAATAKLW